MSKYPENQRFEYALKFLIDSKKVKNKSDFAKKIDVQVQLIYDTLSEKLKLSSEILEKSESIFGISKVWMQFGDGDMLKVAGDRSEHKLIPFYDDVTTIGGKNDVVSQNDSISTPSEYIDAGDWFKEATAAIRHYGESMSEYPSGCILALKEVLDRELIIPGRDYTIETSEYRVTKRLQKGKKDTHVTAYSTNSETYADGRLIHEPFDIPWRAIDRISLVLGYVVKKNGGTMVFNKNDK